MRTKVWKIKIMKNSSWNGDKTKARLECVTLRDFSKYENQSMCYDWLDVRKHERK